LYKPQGGVLYYACLELPIELVKSQAIDRLVVLRGQQHQKCGDKNMIKKTWLRVSISLMFVFTLLCGVFFTAEAAGNQPVLSVVGVEVNNTVQIQAMYLPADTDFSIRMGASGTNGIGAPIIAHVKSSSDGIIFASFEIFSKVVGTSPIDLRLEGGGIVLVTSFDNTNSTGLSPHMVFATPVSNVPPATGTVIPQTVPSNTGFTSYLSDQISIRHVQQGGYVVAGIYDLENGVNYRVFISEANMPYSLGYLVSRLTLGNHQTEMVGTFEIPFQLRYKPQLALHIMGPDYELIANFPNANQ
jgi:hypothetical protein